MTRVTLLYDEILIKIKYLFSIKIINTNKYSVNIICKHSKCPNLTINNTQYRTLRTTMLMIVYWRKVLQAYFKRKATIEISYSLPEDSSSLGLPSPKIDDRVAVSATSLTGLETLRGFKFSLGRPTKSPIKMLQCTQ